MIGAHDRRALREGRARLYVSSISQNSRRVRIAAREFGLPIAEEEVDLLAGDHRTPSYLAKNPDGRVPLLEWDGRRLSESRAILLVLASAADAAWDPQILQWLYWDAEHLSPALRSLQGLVLFSAAPDVDAMAATRTQLRPTLERLERALDDGSFEAARNADGRPNLAELSIAASLTYAEPLQLDLGSAVRRWRSELEARSSFQQTRPSMR
ncbi:MAG: glutathione S-transferase family protein [Myxococcota bacterium]